MAYCCSRSAIRKAVWLPLAIVALHTILYSIAAVIDYAAAWDDMSPTMLVLFAMYIFDYPVHAVYKYLGLFPTNELDRLWYAAQLVLIGGLLWLLFGIILQVVWASLSALIRSTRAWLCHEPRR
jgi:drug/metabolite transporter (DMT)-like permease